MPANTSMVVTHLFFYIQQLVMEHLSLAYNGDTNVTKLLYIFQLVAFVTLYCEPFSMPWTLCVCYFNNVHLPRHCLIYTNLFPTDYTRQSFEVFTRFGHEPQSSSGSYSTSSLMQRVI